MTDSRIIIFTKPPIKSSADEIITVIWDNSFNIEGVSVKHCVNDSF